MSETKAGTPGTKADNGMDIAGKTGEAKSGEMTVAKLQRMKDAELRAICRQKKLPTDVGREALLASATVALFGVTDRYQGKMTRCIACFHRVRVTGSHTSETEDGLRITHRNVECTGPDHHRYSMKEVQRIGAKKGTGPE